MEETELLVLLQQGDNKAFKWLVDAYKQKVAATCYGFTGDYDAALDLAQDVFLEVYRSIHKFRGESKISTWIFRISTNKSLNWLRDNKKHRFTMSLQRFFPANDQKPSFEIKGNMPSPFTELIRDDERKILQRALEQLPANQQTAFVLNKVDDLSYKEVAEIMGVSIATIESLIFRARKNLQKALGDYYKKRAD